MRQILFNVMLALGFFIATIILIAIAPTPAVSQGRNCAPHDVVVERLSIQYGESRQAIALAPGGRVMEMFANLGTGTWTMVVTDTDGTTCLIASGQSYERLDEDIEPAGERL